MLTSIEIAGFKSFGSETQRVSLSPLTFLVGPNASGKTNFLAALRFVKAALHQDAEYAINELGGASEVRHKRERQRQTEKHFRICVRMDNSVLLHPPGVKLPLTVSAFHYTLELDLRRPDDVPLIVHEELGADVAQGEATDRYKLVRDTERVRIVDPYSARGGSEQEFAVPVQERSRPAVSAGFFSLPSVVFREIVEHWNFFNISPQVARQPYRDTPDTTLGMYGENLSVVLHQLETANGGVGLKGLVAGLRGAVPGLEGIKVVRDRVEGKWHLQVVEEQIPAAMNPISISDGTVRLIALLVIAHRGAASPGLIAIEEPENGVHPHLTEHLVGVFREASGTSQIIATTHNPSFLDHLEPEEVLLCGKVDGRTKIRRAEERAEVASFRKHFSLGDLWVQGTFDELFAS